MQKYEGKAWISTEVKIANLHLEICSTEDESVQIISERV